MKPMHNYGLGSNARYGNEIFIKNQRDKKISKKETTLLVDEWHIKSIINEIKGRINDSRQMKRI